MLQNTARRDLDRALNSLQVVVDEETYARLNLYIETLVRWNRSMNLTALAGYELARRLVAEPLWVARRLAPEGHYLDIGSGNGSPALPWLVSCSFKGADLIESRRRRAVFLRQTARKLQVVADVHPVRFDDFSPGTIADWVTLQGVRLTGELREQIASALPAARIAWFTQGTDAPVKPSETLAIPNSSRSVIVFD